MNKLWRFVNDESIFTAKNPHRISRLYFPLANEKGLLSSITPALCGDIKIDQDTFLMPPVSAEDLRNCRYSRNFWVYIKGYGAWSASSGDVEESFVEGGMLYHKVTRVNKHACLEAEFTNFIPVTGETVEIMSVKLRNISGKNLRITPTTAIPLYGRSADRLRDHRHASSLLNRILIDKYGVILRPTMIFDERGHRINTTSYFVFGCDSDGNPPLGSFPSILEFTGEEGNLDKPEAVLKNIPLKTKPAFSRQGKEAIGALRFKPVVLKPGGLKRYIIVMGITGDASPKKIFQRFNSQKKANASLLSNKIFWSEKTNSIYLDTGNKDYDRWFKWVTLQPILRKLFGCSFLPDFDYGRGGRGWRDLWQDCLTLLLINPGTARSILVNNFCGVRRDGSNATIIGRKQGEFVSDRNNIGRVWMDHGIWPFMTVNLYINQTGDTDILFKKVPYFESRVRGTVLEHILSQHMRPFTKIGRHRNFLLEGADWNDSLDMAKERGESVAFTAMYAGNLRELANLLQQIISSPPHSSSLSMKKSAMKAIIDDLRKKAHRLTEEIRNNEWVTVKSGHSFFNGYYDNKSRRVEGDHKNGVRMTLTGQVFSIMSGVATEEQIKAIYRSAKRYLWDRRLRGFRLNTDFGGIYPEMGRAFGFAYGEKENGSFFNHMNIMFAYALYKRNFVREGFEVMDSIYRMCLRTELSKIYPGLPEYFNSEGRGMYHYLTGSASWFVVTMVTQVFGIRGKMGGLLIEPKLVKEQFARSGRIALHTYFAGRRIIVNYSNPKRLGYGRYRIDKITVNGRAVYGPLIERCLFLKLASISSDNTIDVHLS